MAGTTAYDLTHQVELVEGQNLLIIGAGGGVGHLAAQIGAVHQFRVIGVASMSKQQVVESTGATFVAAGDGALQRVQELAPDGVELLVDLVGGQVLRDLAPAATSPARILSAADGDTAAELGGAGREVNPESLEKVTEVIGYEVITPDIAQIYPLDQVRQALADVETGHATGKVVIQP